MTLNLSLPDQNGLAVIRDIRENDATRELPVIVVSAVPEADAADIQTASLTGAHEIADWLEKRVRGRTG